MPANEREREFGEERTFTPPGRRAPRDGRFSSLVESRSSIQLVIGCTINKLIAASIGATRPGTLVVLFVPNCGNDREQNRERNLEQQ